jgi:hypothetical protein
MRYEVRTISRPATAAANAQLTELAPIARPARVGLNPIAPWM